MSRRGLVAALGLSLIVGSAGFDSFGGNTVSAAEPGPIRSFMSKTLNRFKSRSAEDRYQQYKADESARLAAQPVPNGNAAAAVPQFDSGPSVFTLVSKDDDGTDSGEGAVQPSTFPESPSGAFEPGLIEPLAPATPAEVDLLDSGYQAADADSRNLKSIRDIQPFHDYQPGTMIKQELDPEFVAPTEIELGEVSESVRNNEAILYQWQASNLHHMPLYFEDPNLERYGHVHHELVQPFVSVGKFGLQLVGLPYQMTIDPVCKKQYTLGWYRPGECAPKQTPQIPWNSTAALNQAAVTTGVFFAVP